MQRFRSVSMALFGITLSASAFADGPEPYLAAIRRLPPNAIKASLKLLAPDEQGRHLFNRRGWENVGLERAEGQALLIGLATKDDTLIKDTIGQIKGTFKDMHDDGSWDVIMLSGKKAPKSESVSANVFYLAELVPAVDLLQSYDGGKYKSDAADLKPLINKAADFAYDNRETLIKPDSQGANRMMKDAQTFYALGRLFNSSRYTMAGSDFLRRSLELQNSDGAFLELGGPDTSYQAVSLNHLSVISFYEPTNMVKDALKKGARWWLGKFQADGRIDARGNSRTGVGHIAQNDGVVTGNTKWGHQPAELSMALALIAEALPDSDAPAKLTAFTKIGFKGNAVVPPKNLVVTDGN